MFFRNGPFFVRSDRCLLLVFQERPLSCEMTQLVSLSLDCAEQAVSVVRAQFCLSQHFSFDVRGRKAQGKVASPSNGSRIDNGAVSALYREKKKAEHTLHDHPHGGANSPVDLEDTVTRSPSLCARRGKPHVLGPTSNCHGACSTT